MWFYNKEHFVSYVEREIEGIELEASKESDERKLAKINVINSTNFLKAIEDSLASLKFKYSNEKAHSGAGKFCDAFKEELECELNFINQKLAAIDLKNFKTSIDRFAERMLKTAYGIDKTRIEFALELLDDLEMYYQLKNDLPISAEKLNGYNPMTLPPEILMFRDDTPNKAIKGRSL